MSTVGVVEAAFEAAVSDPARFAALFAPDIQWHVCAGPEHAFTGTFAGAAGITRYRRLVDEEADGTFQAHLRCAAPIGDDVVSCIVDVEVVIEERPQRFAVAWVCRVLDGRIAEVWDVVPRVPAQLLRAARRAVDAVDCAG